MLKCAVKARFDSSEIGTSLVLSKNVFNLLGQRTCLFLASKFERATIRNALLYNSGLALLLLRLRLFNRILRKHWLVWPLPVYVFCSRRGNALVNSLLYSLGCSFCLSGHMSLPCKARMQLPSNAAQLELLAPPETLDHCKTIDFRSFRCKSIWKNVEGRQECQVDPAQPFRFPHEEKMFAPHNQRHSVQHQNRTARSKSLQNSFWKLI